ncbi:MAG: peptidoglycan bridge formation glycyltransferase FemA/FemB family protein [Candidatus Sulfotelmatobacter sp.]
MPDLAYDVEVDRTSPAEWSAMLDLFDDANLYQTWSYGAIRWGSKNLSHLVLKRNGEVLGMAQLRIIRPTTLKFGIAYLRWGPLCHRRGAGLEPEKVLRMARALQEEYVSKRRLLLRVLPNAFVGTSRTEVFQSSFAGFSPEPHTHSNTYRTFLLDLAPPLQELRRNLDKKWRNALTRSEKNGLKIVAGSGTGEYQVFCQMYNQMRKRKGFETSVDVEEFGRIQQDLPENHRKRIMICMQEGVPVAGIVSTAMGNSASYLLGATSDEGLNSKGAYLLQWSLIQWLKENGFKWYDLGGIDPEGNPGVYHFKSGFSGADVCHMSPLVASNSVVTSAIITSGEAAYRSLRGCLSKLRRARPFAQSAT